MPEAEDTSVRIELPLTIEGLTLYQGSVSVGLGHAPTQPDFPMIWTGLSDPEEPPLNFALPWHMALQHAISILEQGKESGLVTDYTINLPDSLDDRLIP